MIIKKFIIADYKDKEANFFEFAPTANIITADANTQGKSCLLKSLFYALGMGIKNFKTDWRIESKMLKVIYEHNGVEGSIIRAENKFWVDDNSKYYDLKEYAGWLSEKLAVNMMLPIKANSELRTVYPSALLLPFYIDQDTSWSKCVYKEVVNELGGYAPSAIPKNIFEYLFNISNDEIIVEEEVRARLNSEKKILTTQRTSLYDLKDNFIQESYGISFSEEDALEDIKKYLTFANNIHKKISEKQAKIYTKEIELDSLKLELTELNELLNNTNSVYKKIDGKCSYCDSELTTEQSLRRLKLDDNKLEIGLLQSEILNKIKEVEQALIKLSDEKLSLDKDYSEILKISEKKYGDYTLPEYIEDRAKKITKDNYYQVENKLSLNIIDKEKLIKETDKRLRELKKGQKEHQEEISYDFEASKMSFKIKFSDVNIDDRAFLNFTGIYNSGATNNEEFFIIYMIYIKLLIKYSRIEMPFGIDSTIKDELDIDNIKRFYEVMDKNILNTNKQSFVVMLKDKLNYLKENNYKLINLKKPILDKNKYEELKDEFSVIFAE